jgi:TrmH family RNA methyltransferase
MVRYILLAETGSFPADWDLVDPDGRVDPLKRLSFPGVGIYLEDIRSPFNVGAIFRSAESFGVEKLYLSPLCADPLHPRAARTAMGCVSILPWERLSGGLGDDPAGPFFALETGGRRLRDFPFPPRGIMIVGSEELGVSPRALAQADRSLGRLSIPTYGAKGSLNVSVAFGIAMQAWAAALAENP